MVAADGTPGAATTLKYCLAHNSRGWQSNYLPQSGECDPALPRATARHGSIGWVRPILRTQEARGQRVTSRVTAPK
jgi:hypothetical protein